MLQMMTGLECGHLYCTSCWTEYLTTKIIDEGASESIGKKERLFTIINWSHIVYISCRMSRIDL